jgi:peptidoglycan-N-acetylglucosamine deacetylase
MYFIRTPDFVKSLFPSFIWTIKEDEKSIYLTFDDGPVPELTPWTLDILNQYQAKATFFCVGENVDRYPDIFQMILKEGHQVGNHTYNHLAGWNTENIDYFRNIRKCAQLVKTDLFRPPYGKLKPKQVEFISRHYKIVMWDVLSGDFDDDNTPERCMRNVVNNVKNGSIVVYHDSIKSMANLKGSLPKVIETLQSQGYIFKTLGAKREAVSEFRLNLAPTI